MNVKIPFGYGYLLPMSAFIVSACNAHLTALDHTTAPLEYAIIQTHEELSANLDQILQTRLYDFVNHSNRIMISDTGKAVDDTDLFIMDDIDIHHFRTNGQMHLDCYGFYCDGVGFNGNVVIDINHYSKDISMEHMRLQDEAKMFTLSGRISKSFGAVSTILNPATIEMTLKTPNIDIPLDSNGVLNIRDLPPYDHHGFQTDVELSHALSQTYLTGQLISVSD